MHQQNTPQGNFTILPTEVANLPTETGSGGVAPPHTHKHTPLEGGFDVAEHGNWPIFSTESGKIVCILADFGKQEYCRTRKFCILKDGIRQSSNPTDTDIA